MAQMIFLFTDFGIVGPYVGQMKAVLARRAPQATVIDLMHDAPAYGPKFAAYLLAALAGELPSDAIVLGVVDPGVGDAQRRPVVLEAAGRRFVGPDNGLFAVAALRAEDPRWWEITWRPEHLSNTFHGRDLFARRLDGLRGVAPQDMMAACGIPEVLREERHHRVEDAWVDGRRSVVIEIDHSIQRNAGSHHRLRGPRP